MVDKVASLLVYSGWADSRIMVCTCTYTSAMHAYKVHPSGYGYETAQAFPQSFIAAVWDGLAMKLASVIHCLLLYIAIVCYARTFVWILIGLALI